MNPQAKAVLRGTLGFAAVSLAAYSVWAFAGGWFKSEAALYSSIALAFVALSGVALHPLAGSLPRFYKSFVPAFLAYAAVWCLAWFTLHSRLGEWLGSLGGSVAFAVVAGLILGKPRASLQAAAVLFFAHSVGYFMGADFYEGVKPQARTLARLGWGLFHGLGFGAGIGYAFFQFREEKPS